MFSELEALLHSRIATTANLAQLQEAVAKPQEKIARYDRLERASLTSLCQSIAKIEGHDDDHFNNLVQYAALASSELGSWCADRFWSLSFADDDADRMERKLEHKIARAEGQGTRSAAELQRLLGVLRQMKAVIMTSELQPPTVSNKDLSSKVLKLCEYLTYHYTHDSNIKGIVFVQRRRTAIVLADLFTQLQIPNLRCGSLIGARGWDMGEITVTFRAQTLALMKFRKGELNCLFATSIAEEGLDIPDCNLVVRFDLYSTLIQYIQSRGRARHKSSHYIHMVESGNGDHMNAVGEAHKAEILLRAFCEKLPEDRKLRGLESDLRSAIGKGHTRVYQVPETGAKLTYNAALTILAHYLSCLVGTLGHRPLFIRRC